MHAERSLKKWMSRILHFSLSNDHNLLYMVENYSRDKLTTLAVVFILLNNVLK